MNAPESKEREPLAPGLYLVATPIGNLEDITLRALRVLRAADRIACEDTRQTAKLLSHFGITTPTVSYHLHNEVSRAQELIDSLREGGRIALVSDAGTPAIADPGAAIVSAAIDAGIAVYPIPGANAALTALVASGLSTERFTFHGFLPSKSGQRRSALEQLRAELSAADSNYDRPPATHIFYETPHRILDALADVATILGPAHRIVLARELTKLHEEHLRGSVSEVLATLQQRPSIRGEIVVLLEGTLTTSASAGTIQQSLADEVHALLRSGASEKDALKQVAKSRGLGKSDAYREWQRRKR
ncbi:MAG TPA: 16S rRNA (cytidine(1402)-2'-O)-methyltransferase [Acidobacteriaceae bacterium]